MRWIVVAASTLWMACAAASPSPTLFLLRAPLPERSGRVEAPQTIRLGRVEVAPYLRTPGIVVETEAGQLNAARAHQWAEPLESGLRSSLGAGISAALGYGVTSDGAGRSAGDYGVDVYIDRLHGTMTGSAFIDASYRITRLAEAGDPIAYRFSRTIPLPREGYAGLVQAELELTRELAAAIAASLRELGAP